MLHFSQIEGKTLHQKKDYGSVYSGGPATNLQYLYDMPVLLKKTMCMVRLPLHFLTFVAEWPMKFHH